MSIEQTNQPKEPNLFDYAYSELSQDAVLAWLLAWADDRCTGALHTCGRRFLASLFAKHELTLPDSVAVEIKQQSHRIDVLAIVNKRYYIVIEDKTWTSEHDDQLARYLDEIQKEEGGAEREPVPIYFKIENQSDYGPAEKAGYAVYTRKDFLSLFKDGADENVLAENAILRDYVNHVQQVEDEYNSYLTLSGDKWKYRAWAGFYTWLQSVFRGVNWDYVNNPSGGFCGCWMDWSGMNKDIDAYIQLEESKACFKIYTEDRGRRCELRDLAQHYIFEAANDGTHPLAVAPNRRGWGDYMTVACFHKDVREFDANGHIDLEKTKANIKKMMEILNKAVELAQQDSDGK